MRFLSGANRASAGCRILNVRLVTLPDRKRREQTYNAGTLVQGIVGELIDDVYMEWAVLTHALRYRRSPQEVCNEDYLNSTNKWTRVLQGACCSTSKGCSAMKKDVT